MLTTNNRVIHGLRKEFREADLYCFGDETVLPLDAPDSFPAGAMYASGTYEHHSKEIHQWAYQIASWRQ